MSTVRFIGSGNIGGTVPPLAVTLGYDVVLSNSGPQTRENFVHELGPHARVAEPAGELAVLSVPPKAYLAVPVQPLSSKPVLDASSYVAQREGAIPGLYDGPRTSALSVGGGDVTAKAVVRRFLDDVGCEAVDARPLASGGRRFEVGAAASVTPCGGLPDNEIVIEEHPDRERDSGEVLVRVRAARLNGGALGRARQDSRLARG